MSDGGLIPGWKVTHSKASFLNIELSYLFPQPVAAQIIPFFEAGGLPQAHGGGLQHAVGVVGAHSTRPYHIYAGAVHKGEAGHCQRLAEAGLVTALTVQPF